MLLRSCHLPANQRFCKHPAPAIGRNLCTIPAGWEQKNELFGAWPLLTNRKDNYIMKLASILISLLTAAPAFAGPAPSRSDINPALRYYQAFILAPDLDSADRDFLFDRDWRGQKLPPKFGELLGRYDSQFRIVREAIGATVECDWGIDMTPGPATLLPHLARNKQIAQTARLRAMWELQQGKPTEACE